MLSSLTLQSGALRLWQQLKELRLLLLVHPAAARSPASQC